MSEDVTLKEYFQEKFDSLHDKLDTKFDNVNSKFDSIEKRIKKVEDETEVTRVLEKNDKIDKAVSWSKSIYSVASTLTLIILIMKVIKVF